jgi:hypothetical protein
MTASLNPNLTVEDLRQLGNERIAALEKMGDVYIARMESMDDPEYRAQYMCETFGTFVNLWFQMSI